MSTKILEKTLFVMNIILAIISFLIAVAFITSNNRLGTILGICLIGITGGQYYLQQLNSFKSKAIASLISLVLFIIITEIAYKNHI